MLKYRLSDHNPSTGLNTKHHDRMPPIVAEKIEKIAHKHETRLERHISPAAIQLFDYLENNSKSETIYDLVCYDIRLSHYEQESFQ